MNVVDVVVVGVVEEVVVEGVVVCVVEAVVVVVSGDTPVTSHKSWKVWFTNGTIESQFKLSTE